MAHLFHHSSLCGLSNSSPLYLSDSSLQVYSRIYDHYSFQIVLNENFFETCCSFWKIYFFPVLLLMIYTLTRSEVYLSCPPPEFKAKQLMLLREKNCSSYTLGKFTARLEQLALLQSKTKAIN